jgi:putative addiction module killer protein
VFEYKIDFGPGYRVYFGQDKNVLIILLTGGTKKTQRKDIEKAKTFWQEYKYGKK